MKRRIGLMVLCVGFLALSSRTLLAQERWVYRYDGPGNNWDEANSIVMGSDGNLYAAGRSVGSGTSDDFTVVSLTDSGVERWVYRYDAPTNGGDEANSIVMGSDGNLYAAGYSWGSGTFADFTVTSLTSSGTERWVYRYDGPGSNWDWANSIVMGSDGNIYAAAASAGSGTGTDFTVVSLTDSGLGRWVYRYNGPGNSRDWANSIIMGSDGNLYAAGMSGGSGTFFDFTVVSLTDSGVERWVYRYNGPGNYDDWANSIVMGSDGNIYAAGMSWGSGTFADFTVTSLTPSGTERWVYRYNGPTDTTDEAYSIAMGSDGNIYAAGMSWGSGTSYDFTVVSLAPDVGVEEKDHRALESQLLHMSVSPIPASSGVRIYYSLPEATEVRLSVYDVCGRLVRNLVNTRQESGSKVVLWDGKDSEERRVASGTYFVRLEASGLCVSRKFVLL